MKMPEYVAVKIMPDKKGTSYNLEVVTDADFVNVVRCKDCKRCDTDTAHHKYFCMRYGMDIPGNWFCADGEKEKV